MATARTRLRNLFVSVGCLPALLISTFAAAPQTRTRVIHVTVTDRQGQPVPGLTAVDFSIKEDGKLRGIDLAEPARQPMQIAILLDDGGPSLGAARQGAGEFVERLQGRAAFSLTTTGGQPQKRVEFDRDPRVLYTALQKLFANTAPTTHFLEALVTVSRDFIKREAGRPVIVAIVSEGQELGSLRANTVLQTLQDSRAIFYYVGLGMPTTSGQRPGIDANRPADSTEHESVQRNTVLGAGPKNSGGRSEQVLQPSGILPIMLEFAGELAGQYTVTYRTDTDRARLEVGSPRPDLRLRAPARIGR